MATDKALGPETVARDLPLPAAVTADRGLIDFLARARPGDVAVLTSADGSDFGVTVEADYYAASGRSCRRLQLVEGDRPTPRIACRDQVGVWRLLPALANRALSRLAGPPAATAGPDEGGGA